MAKKENKESEFTEILLYNTPNGGVKVEIYLQDETIWLTQQKIADLFGVDRSVVTKHLSNIYQGNELSKDQLVQNLHKFNLKEPEVCGFPHPLRPLHENKFFTSIIPNPRRGFYHLLSLSKFNNSPIRLYLAIRK